MDYNPSLNFLSNVPRNSIKIGTDKRFKTVYDPIPPPGACTNAYIEIM